MSIRRLRRVLNAVYSVQIDSSAAAVQLIQRQINKRALAIQSKGKTPPPTKVPAAAPTLTLVTSLNIRPVDLLRKIGDLTTPADTNMATLSASWATRRYFWAIEEVKGQQPRFKLSDDARAMDFHQKTLLSDEFGIGFGGLVLERLFQADDAVDVSAALQNPGKYQNVTQSGTAQPDFLMWSPLANSPYYVVECKGCQTRRNATINQIRRGLEQVPTLVFGTGDRRVNTLVVATLMEASGTTVYVIDSPRAADVETAGEGKKYDSYYEKLGKNTWRINDPEEFANVAWSAKRVKLLNWVGQFASAGEVASRRRRTERISDGPDLELTPRTIRRTTYHGRRIPLFPELGHNELQVFTGVQEEALEIARHGASASEREQAARRVRPLAEDSRLDADTSVGLDGTCLVIEGL